jgi:hypothetical protein
MHLVKQEDPMGCGIACVAFVLSISYKEAVKLFTFPEKRKTLGYRSSELREALKRGGCNSFSRYVGRLSDPKIDIGDIVYVKKCKLFPYGHYLVKNEDGYMDPFINMNEAGGDHTKAKAGKRFILNEKMTMIIKRKEMT